MNVVPIKLSLSLALFLSLSGSLSLSADGRAQLLDDPCGHVPCARAQVHGPGSQAYARVRGAVSRTPGPARYTPGGKALSGPKPISLLLIGVFGEQ